MSPLEFALLASTTIFGIFVAVVAWLVLSFWLVQKIIDRFDNLLLTMAIGLLLFLGVPISVAAGVHAYGWYSEKQAAPSATHEETKP